MTVWLPYRDKWLLMMGSTLLQSSEGVDLYQVSGHRWCQVTSQIITMLPQHVVWSGYYQLLGCTDHSIHSFFLDHGKFTFTVTMMIIYWATEKHIEWENNTLLSRPGREVKARLTTEWKESTISESLFNIMTFFQSKSFICVYYLHTPRFKFKINGININWSGSGQWNQNSLFQATMTTKNLAFNLLRTEFNEVYYNHS